jgi:aminoglycoside phosphotransferase (APT) family kinase protein
MAEGVDATVPPDGGGLDGAVAAGLRRRIEAALGRRVGTVQPLERGTDHAAYLVDDALVARVATRADGAAADEVEREVRLLGLVAPALTPAERRLVERFLAADPPGPVAERVLSHCDLGAEHLLAAPGGDRLTGVLDWSDAALADPAVDLGRLCRDLGPRPAVAVADRLGLGPEVGARAAFYARCALLEDLGHGLTTGDRRYSDAALARTFDPLWDTPG